MIIQNRIQIPNEIDNQQSVMIDSILMKNESIEDEQSLLQTDDTKIQQIFKKMKQLALRLYRLVSQISMEKTIRIMLILYLVVPFVQLVLFLSMFTQFEFNLPFCLSALQLVMNRASKYLYMPFEHLNNTHRFLKHFLIIFDCDNIYSLIKSPDSLEYLLQQRNNLLTNGSYYNNHQSFVYLTIMMDNSAQTLYFIQLALFMITTELAATLKEYYLVYPKAQGIRISQWLNNKTFAISLLHIFSFYHILVHQLFTIGYLSLAYSLFHITSYIHYYRTYKVRNMFYHIAIDIPFTKNYDLNESFLRWGYNSYAKGIQILIIQKSVLIIIELIMLILNFKLNKNTIYAIALIGLSSLSLKILIDRYRKQMKALKGSFPELLDITSNLELNNELQRYEQDKQHFKNLKVVYIINEDTEIEQIIKCLFHSFSESEIICKSKSYLRLRIEDSQKQVVIIKNVLELYSLTLNNNRMAILPQISLIEVKQRILYRYTEIYRYLIANDYRIEINILNERDPSYLVYCEYLNALKSNCYSNFEYQMIIQQFIINNPYQVYYDLYD